MRNTKTENYIGSIKTPLQEFEDFIAGSIEPDGSLRIAGSARVLSARTVKEIRDLLSQPKVWVNESAGVDQSEIKCLLSGSEENAEEEEIKTEPKLTIREWLEKTHELGYYITSQTRQVVRFKTTHELILALGFMVIVVSGAVAGVGILDYVVAGACK